LKSFTIGLLAITFLALAVASRALADSPSTQPSTQPTSQPSTEPSFTADQKDALIAANGTEVTVTGTVSQIRNLTDRVMKISFQGVDRGGFCGIVFADQSPAAHDYFDKGPGAAFVGKQITMSGTVSLFRGGPEIVISDAKQVQVMAAAASQP
jgi:DNA/RNA endonuclease YhcR with UshA esterase domain